MKKIVLTAWTGLLVTCLAQAVTSGNHRERYVHLKHTALDKKEYLQLEANNFPNHTLLFSSPYEGIPQAMKIRFGLGSSPFLSPQYQDDPTTYATLTLAYALKNHPWWKVWATEPRPVIIHKILLQDPGNLLSSDHHYLEACIFHLSTRLALARPCILQCDAATINALNAHRASVLARTQMPKLSIPELSPQATPFFSPAPNLSRRTATDDNKQPTERKTDTDLPVTEGVYTLPQEFFRKATLLAKFVQILNQAHAAGDIHVPDDNVITNESTQEIEMESL